MSVKSNVAVLLEVGRCTSVGRHESNDLRVDDLHASANHCKINVQRASYPDIAVQTTVTDSSRNGTWIAARVGKHSWRTKKLKREEARQLPKNSVLLIGGPPTGSSLLNCPAFLLLHRPEPQLVEIRSFKQAERLLDERANLTSEDSMPLNCHTNTAPARVESVDCESRKRHRPKDLDERKELPCGRSSFQLERDYDMQRDMVPSVLRSSNTALKRFKHWDADATAVTGRHTPSLRQVAKVTCHKPDTRTKSGADARGFSAVDHSDLRVDISLCDKDYGVTETLSSLDMKETLGLYTKVPEANGGVSASLEVERMDAGHCIDNLGGRERDYNDDDINDGTEEEEHCIHCLKLFKLSRLIQHAEGCLEKERSRNALGCDRRGDEEEEEFCGSCLRLFKISELIGHVDVCERRSTTSDLDTGSDRASFGSHISEDAAVWVDVVRESEEEDKELCTFCFQSFALSQLIDHAEKCRQQVLESKSMPEMLPVARELGTDVVRDVMPETVEEEEQCSFCRKLFPLCQLIDHVEGCCQNHSKWTGKSFLGIEQTVRDGVGSSREEADCGAMAGEEKEQCSYCLKLFTLSQLICHVDVCLEKKPDTKNGLQALEQCQFCLMDFQLSEIVKHSLQCDQRPRHIAQDGTTCYSQESDQLERCMHCFRDFPLSQLAAHMMKCEDGLSGPKARFANFIPSVHELDSLAVAVLTERQQQAVDYVLEKSRQATEKVLPSLRKRVQRLGYTERELDKAFQWVRHNAPIIIHLDLGRVLQFLVKDTHYRNLFETATSRGSSDLKARSSWEDRIFNGKYHDSPGVERTKYGVLNVVGDPCGVKSCYCYGDSYLQLKKVRLRTTFASADTSSNTVKLSCCEYYGNVLHEYNDNELKAVLDVANGQVPFLSSSVISVYKEVQIHGPVCLSENVECIVANPRHKTNQKIVEMLETFVGTNHCNLIWMDPQ